MANPSKPLLVALIGTEPFAREATCDPAFDLDWRPTEEDPVSLSKRFSDYVSTRSEADLALIPLKPGKSPVLFEVHALTGPQLRYVRTASKEPEMWARAFLCACRRIVLPYGEKELSTTIAGEMVCARIEWIDDVVLPMFGGAAIDEIGKVAYDRGMWSARARLPFSLPHGLTLPR